MSLLSVFDASSSFSALPVLGILAAWKPSSMGTLLIGAVLGLFMFAFSYALRVVSVRQVRNPETGTSRAEGLLRLVGIGLLVTGAALGVYLFNNGSDLHRNVQLHSRDLFAIMPRAGLFPEFCGEQTEARANESVVRFLRVDDVKEEISRLGEKKERLENELVILDNRTLTLDHIILSDFQRAETAVKSLDSQARDLVDQQAVLARELASGKMERDRRRLDLEQELRGLDNDLGKLRTRLGVADVAVTDAENLLAQGLISRRELTDRQHDLENLRNTLEGVREQRYLLETESAELDSLYERSENSFEVQLALRAERAAGSDTRREEIVLAYRDAALALERERERAGQRRQQEIRNLAAEIRDCERRLDDPMGAVVVSAPWTGRIGFRDPSPMSRLPGQGPLLVMYRPGTIWAEMPVSSSSGVTKTSVCRVSWQNPQTGRTYQVAGRVLELGQNEENHLVAKVAFDPPAPVVASLAMDRMVNVEVSVTPDAVKKTTTQNAAALLTIPAGLALLLRPRRKHGEERAVGGQTGELLTPETSASEGPRGNRQSSRAGRMSGRTGFSMGDGVAGRVGAMEYTPPVQSTGSSGPDRLLAWLPSAILSHDLPRQVMARLWTLDPAGAVENLEWAELPAEDIRAAALGYIQAATENGLQANTLARLTRELDCYCELVNLLTEADGDLLQIELRATLNGAMMATGKNGDNQSGNSSNREMGGQA